MARAEFRCLMAARDRLLIDLWCAAWSTEKTIVSGSTSIEEACHDMEQQQYDVVLIDFPIELALELAETQSHRATRFIVLSEENEVLPHPLPPALTTFSKSAPLGELLHAIRSTLGLPAQSSPANTVGHVLVAEDEDAMLAITRK